MKDILDILATADPTTIDMLKIVGIVLGGVLFSFALWARRSKSTDY